MEWKTFIALGLDNKNFAKSMIQMIYDVKYSGVNANFMDSVDERYLTHYVMHSYLRALQKFQVREKIDVILPFNMAHSRLFRDAGLVTSYNGEYFTIISLHKGGLIKVFKDKDEIFWDCGYRIPVKKGTVAATNWLDRDYKIDSNKENYQINGAFKLVTLKVQNPIYHLGLRVLAFFWGSKVNQLIKKLTIFQNKHFEAFFERKITLNEKEIIISDYIDNPQGYNLEEATNISLRLVASGKFFSRSDLLRTEFLKCGNNKRIFITKTYDIEKRLLTSKIDWE